jgi:hypothetical protein
MSSGPIVGRSSSWSIWSPPRARRAGTHRAVGARVRGLFVGTLVLLFGLTAAACGSSSPSTSASKSPAAKPAAAQSGSCTGVPGTHHARLVVEPSPGKVLARCVGFSGKSLPALELLKKSGIQFGTQKFSFGVAICQVDHVPAHYTQCLPSGQDYWALFVSTNGRTWTSPSVGVSEIDVPPGGSIGLRYDPPTGTPPPPPHPTPA